jgi:prophage regulatory protein
MRLMRLKEVMDATSLARSTVYKYIAAGRFPEPVSLGGRSVAWVQDEVVNSNPICPLFSGLKCPVISGHVGVASPTG